MYALPLLLLALAAPAVNPQHVYDVVVDAQLRQFGVHACFADGLPEQLIADHPLAIESSGDFHYQLDGVAVARAATRQVVHFPVPSDDGCVRWQVDLDAIAVTKRLNIGYRTDNSLLLAPGTWLWRPPALTINREMVIRFHLPASMQISAPWQKLANEEPGVMVFRRDHSPLDWPALMAIGKLHVRTLDIGTASLQLAVTDGPAIVPFARVEQWLRGAAESVAQLWGEFPVDGAQLLVIPVADGRDAAPWAQTSRGGGAAAHFYMNAKATPEVLRDDWIATHELAHFALPFIRRSDAWLSEGFASYYQNVLRARSGELTAQQAWAALHRGFSRGNRDTEYDTLQDDTLYMHSRGRVMRVYWSGAAIAFLADVELRLRSGGEWSLDRVLQEFNRCCLDHDRTWSGREVFEKFDEIAGTDLFDRLYRNNVYSRHFPRLAETWIALGVNVRGDKLQLQDDAPLVSIRTAIMQPGVTATEKKTPGE